MRLLVEQSVCEAALEKYRTGAVPYLSDPGQSCVAEVLLRYGSVANLDPVGSVYYSLSWIRIRISNTDPDPDPAAFKLITIFNFFVLF